MIVKIKSWNEMLEVGYARGSEIDYAGDDYTFTRGMENGLPENRIIELSEDRKWQDGCHYSDWMVAEYLDKLIETTSEQITPQDVAAEYLDSPEHPANQEILPELDEFNLKQVKSDNFKLLKTLRKSASRTHYFKFQLNFSEDYSIRYFLQFEDRKECEGQFVLKSHSKRESSIITRSMAEDLIGKLCEIPCEEIIGRKVGGNYEKIIISENKLVRFTE